MAPAPPGTQIGVSTGASATDAVSVLSGDPVMELAAQVQT
jgi:hypothetical protein